MKTLFSKGSFVWQWCDKLSMRERLILMVTVWVGLYALINFAVLEPVWQKMKAQKTQIHTHEQTLSAIEQALAQRESDLQSLEPKIKAQVQAYEQAMAKKDFTQGIKASERLKVLSQMLEKADGVKILRLNNTKPEAMDEQSDVRLHTLYLSFSSSYVQAMSFLESLEQLKVPWFFSELIMQSNEQGRLVFALKLSFVSQDEAFVRF